MKTSKKQKLTGVSTKNKLLLKIENYDSYLIKELKDLDYAAGYLKEAIEEGEEVFLIALKNVAIAQGGIKILSEATKLNRENLYHMLSKKGNPLFVNINTILNELGLEISFERKAA
jgi:probable addiction module antidote protein